MGFTVGNPFTGSSGPSFSILMKPCSTVFIVFCALITSFNLMGVL